MKIKYLLASCILVATSSPAIADTLSLTLGAGVWNEKATGSINKVGDLATINVQDELFWGTESQGYFYATLEHPVPIIPNVRLMYTTLDQAGSGTANFTFDGVTYSGNVANDFKIKQTDLLAYYEVLDNVVSLDLGLNVRLMDVDYRINSTTGNTTDSASAVIPMLYALVGASPWPDLILSLEGNYMSYSGSSITDITAKIAYTTNFFVGFEAGYRA